MKNGDLWEFLGGIIIAKGPRAIIVTKVKGHATQEMVDEGRIDERQKKGNGGADDGANKGAGEAQQNLSTVARKYASRQWRYKRFMARMHAYIICLRKAAKKKLEPKKRQEHPF